MYIMKRGMQYSVFRTVTDMYQSLSRGYDICRFEIEYRGQQDTTLVIINITRRKSCEAGGGSFEIRSCRPEVNTYQQKDIYLYGADTRIFL
jgi:hypothetical protein